MQFSIAHWSLVQYCNRHLISENSSTTAFWTLKNSQKAWNPKNLYMQQNSIRGTVRLRFRNYNVGTSFSSQERAFYIYYNSTHTFLLVLKTKISQFTCFNFFVTFYLETFTQIKGQIYNLFNCSLNNRASALIFEPYTTL